MGQGLGAVLPIVVVGIVADLLVQLLLHLKVVLLGGFREWALVLRHGADRAEAIVEQTEGCGGEAPKQQITGQLGRLTAARANSPVAEVRRHISHWYTHHCPTESCLPRSRYRSDQRD